MADDQDKADKTEDPTEKRLSDAKNKGQVASSKEPSVVATYFVLGLILTTGLGGYIYGVLEQVMKGYLGGYINVEFTPEGLQEVLFTEAKSIALIVLLVSVPAILISVLINMIISGPVFSLESLQPKFEKVSPMKGFARLFSMKSLAEFIKSVLKMVIISTVAYFVILDLWPMIPGMILLSVDQTAQMAVKGVAEIVLLVALFFVFLAMADIVYQKYEFTKSQKMSLKDIKDENKESEGDPHLKGRIRQLQHEQAQKRMMQDVPKADVVITNPTHIAIALKYDAASGGAPVVVAKGKGMIAAKIREIARENDVPMRENKPLARSMFKLVNLGDEIPEHLFEAVAMILAEVMNQRASRGY
ncbi:MAG: flagellar biosynthesis protein FlhB [Zetaproteobacteria bacterium]|nr:flagellar biosynthesis protein FlhB [Zetaproteobacteria bacterium]